jgi:hypothetical protein
MKRPEMDVQTEACCEWCQRPVRLCRDSSCDDAGIYVGLPSNTGRWIPLEAMEAQSSRLAAVAG